MANPDASVVKCQCGVKLRIPPNAGGKRVRCPKCGFRIAIPTDGAPVAVHASAVASEGAPARAARKPAAQTDPSRRTVSRPPAPPAVRDDGDSLLDDLIESESTAETTAGADLESRQKSCPSCKAAMPKDATTCVMCGHDLRAKPATPPAGRGKKVKALGTGAAKAGGRFVIGCALSSAGALVGALIWFGVAIATDREFGLIAILLGALCGGGMALGNKKPSSLAGVVAVLITIAGIVGARVLIFSFVLYGMFTGETSDIDAQREYVVWQTVEQRLDEESVWSPRQREEKWDQYYEDAEAEVAAMSDSQVRAKWRELRDKDAGLFASIDHERLAEHRATRRMQAAGAEPYGDEYNGFYNEEMVAVRGMSKAEVETALADLDRWESGGKWEDAAYVREHLIYAKAEDAHEVEMRDVPFDENTDYEALSSAAWEKHYAQAVTEVDALPPEEQLAQAKTYKSQAEREMEEFEAELQEKFDNISGSDVALGVGALILAFFFAFGLFGTIFTIIAAVTAYRLASAGIGT